MQIKNKIIITTICVLSLFISCFNLQADEFNISASEITIDKENEIIRGKGSVVVTDYQGRIIKANNVIYKKKEEILLSEGSVKIFDTEGNIITTDKATYDKKNETIITYNNSELLISDGYKLISNKVIYNTIKKIISSDQNSTFFDTEGNIVKVEMFQYHIEKNLFSSIGKINIIDTKKNEYFFKELHIDTKKKEMIGSDVSVLLDQTNFGVSKESDPRFVANHIFMSKNKSNLSKGVFTVCKEREGRCPPWILQAKKISHDKVKKTIYYKHAVLKVYDIPIFYSPIFFHPDPTVKRQSGFLAPFFTRSTAQGNGFGLPYFWAISHDRDLTFTLKTYVNENPLFLNEYRQAFKNGFLTLDTGFTEGYKNTNSTKTSGSRNHIFTDLFLNLSKNSNLSIKTQSTNNNTYFKLHDINTALVDAEKTGLENKISYNFKNNDLYLDISGTVYEELGVSTNNRYEYISPNILFGKSFFTEKFGTLDFKSDAYYKNFDTNKHTTVLTNDLIWSPGSYVTKKGFVNSFEGLISNRNYEASNTTDYKTDGTVNELSSALGYKTTLPMEKESIGYLNYFSPNFMVRYAPGHMRNLSKDDLNLTYANIYSLNKTSEIEDGLSAVLGFDFKVNKKNENGGTNEKLSISMGQVFNTKDNKDIPSRSSLDQKTSDLVGEINYNFSKIGSIEYKFSLDHNYNDLNYNEVGTNLNFGRVAFNLDYLEEQNHVGNEHYINAGIDLEINDHNKFSFATKKNYTTNSTEFYNISYQYAIDCLTAGLVYRREFYEDNDVEPTDKLMFTFSFVPFTGVRTPYISP